MTQYPDYGSSRVLWNVATPPSDYTASRPGRQWPSLVGCLRNWCIYRYSCGRGEVYLEWQSVFLQTGGFYQNRKTQDMSIDSWVLGSVIARYTCLCFVQAKRTHVSEGDTTRITESRKISLLREELREKFFVFRPWECSSGFKERQWRKHLI